MQTRPFFKKVFSLFKRPHETAPPPPPKTELVTDGGFPLRKQKRKRLEISPPNTTDPRFMSRAARVRAGMQPNRLTWYKARRKRDSFATLQPSFMLCNIETFQHTQ